MGARESKIAVVIVLSLRNGVCVRAAEDIRQDVPLMKVGRYADSLQGDLGISGPGLGLGADFYRLFVCKLALNCCSIRFLIHEEKEEVHPKMLYSNKIFKASNEIFCKFGASMATLPAELLLRKEASCFNEPTGSLRRPAHICLVVSWLLGVHTLKQIDGAQVRLSRL